MFADFFLPIWNDHIKKYRTNLLFGCSKRSLDFLEGLTITDIESCTGKSFSVRLLYKNTSFVLKREPIFHNELRLSQIHSDSPKEKTVSEFFDFSYSFSQEGNYLSELFSFESYENYENFISVFDDVSFYKYIKEYRIFNLKQEFHVFLSNYNDTPSRFLLEDDKVWLVLFDGKKIPISRLDNFFDKWS